MLKDPQTPRNPERRTHRTYSPQFKAELTAACRIPGASIAALALQHGMNANVLHRWLKEWEQGRHRLGPDASTLAVTAPTPAFIPVNLSTVLTPPAEDPPTATPPTAAHSIRIDCQRAGLSVTVLWPLSGAAECAQMLRELLR